MSAEAWKTLQSSSEPCAKGHSLQTTVKGDTMKTSAQTLCAYWPLTATLAATQGKYMQGLEGEALFYLQVHCHFIWEQASEF